MALFKHSFLTTTPSDRQLEGGAGPDGTPFRLFIAAVDDDKQNCSIRVSRYSAILASPNITDKIIVIGIDLPLPMAYGDKIWVETFYDKNLTPVFAIINTGKKWDAQVVNPADSSTPLKVYPKEQEFITRGDAAGKLGDLEKTTTSVNSMKKIAIDEITYRKDRGIVSETEFADLSSAIDTQYQAVLDLISTYKKNMNQFFSTAPTALWKKLFRTFTLIGYTTHETSFDLDASLIDPKATPPATAPSVPQASKPVSFRLVQCLSSDLYLADMCYQNRYPAKLPVPYHRAVYTYTESGKNEETTNTA